MREYTFDAKLFATVRIKAADLATARRILNGGQFAVTFGMDRPGDAGGVDWIDCTTGDPDGRPDLIEIDGEAV